MEPTAQPATSSSQRASEEVFLSVVIPAYNESSRLPDALGKVKKYLNGRDYSYEVLVVDDGSDDNTVEVVEREAKNHQQLRVIRNPHRGKGYAVRTGMLQASGKYILYSDADFSAPIEEVEKLLPYLRGRYDIAIGSREGLGAARYDEPVYRHIMGRVFNTFVRLVALPQFNDTQCGFKAFRREASDTLFRSLHLYGDNAADVKGAMVTGFDVEVLYLAQKWGYKTKEVPVKWYYSKGTNVNPLRDTFRMLQDIAKVRRNDLRGLYRKRR
ncbi:MAG: glycosyltransferase family 2 protein [Chloroflexota bacterium]|nr:glycosyltransferase family 2 protein [Chloroflexota bacterium]